MPDIVTQRGNLTMISKRHFLGAAAVAVASPAFGQNPIGKRRIMNGPMIGAVTPTSITVWARASGPHPVQVQYDADPAFQSPRVTAAVMAQEADDYTVRITVTGLTPDTTYHYRLLVEERPDDYQEDLGVFPVRTAPASTTAPFSIAFGSCCRRQRHPVQPVWQAIHQAKPDLFFWLGDNVYADSLFEHVYQEEYRAQRNLAEMQPVNRTIPQLATWDDHDFGLNNQDRSNPVKDMALKVFKQYWANPSYGLPDTPGVFFKYSYSGVEFFFIDGRMYRDPNAAPDGPEKTQLGAAQYEWLTDGLKASDAVFKVIVSGSGWSKAKGHGGDSWASHLTERNRLFDFIRDEAVNGVILLSGDTHVGELNCIPWSENGGYDLYDLVSSPLAQNPTDSWLERRPERRMRQPFFRAPNFGHLSFEFDDEPTATFVLKDYFGATRWHPLVLNASDLRNGVSTWRDNMDQTEFEAWQREQEGGAYYPPL